MQLLLGNKFRINFFFVSQYISHEDRLKICVVNSLMVVKGILNGRCLIPRNRALSGTEMNC